jgi:beta-lactamase superfamily II metal-dependent hydrolase
MAEVRRKRHASSRPARGAGRLAKTAKSSPSGEIRVRMYRVGFGDCFLLSLPQDGGQAHILVDCGVHSKGDAGTMPSIVDDIAAQSGKHLNLVIATHAHQDHISGFAKCEAEFKTFVVDEVWLPWTENPKDDKAKEHKQKRLALSENLRQHFAATNISPTDDTAMGQALCAVMNAADNRTALDLLHSGFGGATVRYLEANQSFVDSAGIKGLSARIMGPPRDQEFLTRMDPPKGDRFLHLDSAGKIVSEGVVPFPPKWYFLPESKLLTSADIKSLDEATLDAAGLAFALDQILNNTSIVAFFTFHGKTLLFPGDAQYGNWQSWMNMSDSQTLFDQLDFFKVAHHGSVNATPKSALERMHVGFAAMISTQNKPWPSIPFDKILVELDQRASAGVVRSDSIKLANAPASLPQGPQLSLRPGFEAGPFWCDYTLAI